MAIKGLTDNIESRLPRLGKLRKGGERVDRVNSKGKKYQSYGDDLDHFRFTSPSQEIVDAFVAAYGETPRTITCYLPYPTPETAFQTWSEIWNASGLVHRCDGVNMTRWLEGDKYIDGQKPCPGGHTDGDYLNDAVGRLDVILPELVEAGYVGYVTLETHSKNDIVAILSTLTAVYDARQDNPLGLKGILFNLRRVKENISIPGYGERKGQRARADKWLVKLEPAAEWIRLQLEMAHASQYAGELPAWTGVPGSDETIDAQFIEQPVVETPPAKTNGAAKTNGKANGSAPVGKLTLAEQINELGARLWPRVWPEKKEAIAKVHTKNGQVDLQGILKALQEREQSLMDRKVFAEHVSKSWPGFEETIAGIEKEHGATFDRLAALRGIAAAAEARALAGEPLLPAQNYLDMIVIEMEVPEGF